MSKVNTYRKSLFTQLIGTILISIIVLSIFTNVLPINNRNESIQTSIGGFRENASVNYSPSLVAYDKSNGNLYVTNYLASSISVINGRNYSLMGTITVGSYPQGIAYDDLNGYIYVSNGNSSYISVINGSTNNVVDNISVARGGSVAYDPSNNDIYVLTGHIVVINSSSNRVVKNLTAGAEPSGISYDSLNGRLYVANYVSDNVTVINGVNNTVIGSIQIGPQFNKSNPQGPVSVAADPLNGLVYAVVNSHYVYVINSTTDEIIGNISTGSYLQGISYDPSNGFLYVVSETFPGKVSVIDGSTNKVIGTITVGNGPVGIAYDSASNQLFVANQEDNTVTAINGTTNRVTATVSVIPGRSGYATGLMSSQWIYIIFVGAGLTITTAAVLNFAIRRKRKK